MLRCPHDTDNERPGDLFEVCKLFKMYVSSNDSQNVKSQTAQFILKELDLNLKSHICLKFFWWNTKVFTLIHFSIFTSWDWHSGWVIYAKSPWLLWVPRRVRWLDSPFISTSVSVVSGFPVSRCTKCINLLLFKSLCCMCNLYIKHFEMYPSLARSLCLLQEARGCPLVYSRGIAPLKYQRGQRLDIVVNVLIILLELAPLFLRFLPWANKHNYGHGWSLGYCCTVVL